MLEEVITKILLGISLAAPIGPVCAEMVKRGLAAGFWAAFNVRLGGAIANLFMLLLAYFGVGIIMQYHQVMFVITILGAIALIYLGSKNIIRGLDKKPSKILINKHHAKKYSIINSIFIGFSLSFASPLGIMFWLSTFATSIQQNSTTFDFHDLLINLFIIVGVLLWGIFISLILHFFSKYINEKRLKIITMLSGFILLYFGIKYGIIGISKIR